MPRLRGSPRVLLVTLLRLLAVIGISLVSGAVGCVTPPGRGGIDLRAVRAAVSYPGHRLLLS